MSKLKSSFIDFGTGAGQTNAQSIPANFTPSNYTPAQVGSEGADQISSHLKGIDAALGSGGGTVSKDTAAVISDDWSASGNLYKQTVELPTGFTMGSISISTYETSSGDQVFPTIKQGADSGEFDVYVNDNTIGLTFVFFK